MGEVVFRAADGREERHAATDATAAKHVMRYAELGMVVRAFRVGPDGADGAEIRPCAAAFLTPMRDRNANLRTNRRGRGR